MANTTVKLEFDKDTLAELDAWHDQVRSNAIEIVQKTLPAKVLSLNRKLAQMEGDKKHLLSRHHYLDPSSLATDVTVHPPLALKTEPEPPSSKKRKATETASVNGVPAEGEEEGVYRGVVHASDYLERVWDELRAEWDEMITIMDALKMYINLQMPQIEDGDTFGVSVQEEALNEVVRSQDSAYNLLSTPFNNYTVRGDLAAKLVRFPGVQDYALALKEHDRKSIYRAHMQLIDTRNMYAVVLDILRKNISKVSKPKSGNQMGSYG